MSAPFNRWAVERDGRGGYKRRGRPILNQTKELEHTPEVLPHAFGDAWQRFVAEVRHQDQHGRFRSGFFSALGV
jgi:hypothetical protein